MVTMAHELRRCWLCTGCKTHLRAAPFPPGGRFPTVTSPENTLERRTLMNAYNDMESYNRMLDAARLRAFQLRREAIADAYAAAGQGISRALRSATRFGHSLKRHFGMRARTTGTTCRT
jgi:hypothetical protein